MGMSAVLDTNIVLFFLKGLTVVRNLPGDRFLFSVITEIEHLGYRNIDAQQEESIRRFLAHVEVMPLDDIVKHKTIELRRTMNIKIPDAIIAATAICAGAQLISNDDVMMRIPGITCSKLALRQP